MKKLRITIILLSLCIVSCVLAACVKPKEEPKQLDTPYNFSVQGNALFWRRINNASGYIVYLDGNEYQTKSNYFSLALLTEARAYDIEVIAVGDGKLYLNSEKGLYTHVVEGSGGSSTPIPDDPIILLPTENLEYNLLEDGSGYEVSVGAAYLKDTLVIPDYYNELPVKKIADYGFSSAGNEDKIKVILPSTLEEIGYKAFYLLEGITKIEIPQNVTTIGESAFSGITTLEEVILSDKLTTIKNYAFSYCSSLEHIIIPNSVFSVGEKILSKTKWMLTQPSGCVINNGVLVDYKFSEDKNVVVPSGVRLIAEGAFSHTDITSATIPDGVKLGGRMFCMCNYLTTVNLPSDLKSIPEYTFFHCSELKEVNLPEGLISIGQFAFSSCTSLTKIELPTTLKYLGSSAFAQIGLTSVTLKNDLSLGEYVFSGCKNLKTVIVDGIKTIPKGTFSGCGNLSSITLNEGTEVIEDAFNNCLSIAALKLPFSLKELNGTFRKTNLGKIELPKNLETIGEETFKDCTFLHTVIFPKNLKVIGDKAFIGCTALSAIKLPEGLEAIGDEAFKDCTLLNEVDCIAFNNLDSTIRLQQIGNEVFSGCIELKSIQLPLWIDNFGIGVFSNCASLTEVGLPLDCEAIEEETFKGCTSLYQINMLNSIKTIKKNAFESSGLTSITLNEGLTEIEPYAFKDCVNLANITWPKTLQKVGNSAFSGCGFKSLTIPGYVPIRKGSYAFRSCEQLNEVILEGAEEIPQGMFSGCKSLTKVVLPEGLKEIESIAFANTSIEQIEFPSTIQVIESNAFRGCKIVTVELPDGITDASGLAKCETLIQVTVPVSLTAKIDQLVIDNTSIKIINFKGTKEQWEQNIPAGFVLPDGVTLNFLG